MSDQQIMQVISKWFLQGKLRHDRDEYENIIEIIFLLMYLYYNDIILIEICICFQRTIAT